METICKTVINNQIFNEIQTIVIGRREACTVLHIYFHTENTDKNY